MISTHADSLLAETIRKGYLPSFTEDELRTMWEAVWKDASVPPAEDESTVYSDREEVSVRLVHLILALFSFRHPLGRRL